MITQTSVCWAGTCYLYWWHAWWADLAAYDGLSFKRLAVVSLCISCSMRGNYGLTLYTWTTIGTMKLCLLSKCLHLAVGCCTGSLLRSVSCKDTRVRLVSHVGSGILFMLACQNGSSFSKADTIHTGFYDAWNKSLPITNEGDWLGQTSSQQQENIPKIQAGGGAWV